MDENKPEKVRVGSVPRHEYARRRGLFRTTIEVPLTCVARLDEKAQSLGISRLDLIKSVLLGYTNIRPEQDEPDDQTIDMFT